MTPETPTPRTDAIAHRGYNESAYIAEMTSLARQLERELAEVMQSLAFQTQLNREVIGREKQTHAELAAERALADKLGTWVRALYRDKIVPTFCEESVHRAINTWEEARK